MKFRLQRVLDLRHAQEKIAQQELATRQQDYQAILGRLDQLLEDESTLFELIKRQDDSSIYLPKDPAPLYIFCRAKQRALRARG